MLLQRQLKTNNPVFSLWRQTAEIEGSRGVIVLQYQERLYNEIPDEY